MTFGETFSPYLLQDVEGIYSVDANVYSTDNSLIDGATIHGSVIRPRNIVITIADKESFPRHRNFLYFLFRPKTVGELIYHEIDKDFEERRSINYVVEKVEPDTEGNTRQIVISLLCADPFFSDMDDVIVDMVTWDKQFEFQHEFSPDKEELGEKTAQKLITVENDSTVGNIGMVITMDVEGNVTNPKMYHVESDSYIQLGTASYPLNLVYGDRVIISTVLNDKNAYLIRGGTTTVINEYIDENSDYIQLVSGTNTLRYSASSGENSLLVRFSFRQKYLGV